MEQPQVTINVSPGHFTVSLEYGTTTFESNETGTLSSALYDVAEQLADFEVYEIPEGS